MSVCNVLARLGGIIAPLVITLDSIIPGLSILLMGGAALISGIFSFRLPETLNLPLPNTINEITS
jgi:hypothetical protein